MDISNSANTSPVVSSVRAAGVKYHVFFVAKMVARTVLLVVCVSFVSYILLQRIPGNTRDALLGLDSTVQKSTVSDDSDSSFMRQIFQYGMWARRAALSHFGTSELTGLSVRSMILARWGTTALLALASFIFGLLGAVFFARAIDSNNARLQIAARGGIVVLLSFPPFTLALCTIIAVTALRLPLPIFYGNGIARYVLPTLVLAVAQIPVYTQSLVSSVMLVKREQFVTFAHSLGFSERRVWWTEVLPNAFLFTLDVAAIQLGTLLGGTVIVETIFSLSGVGSLLVHSVLARDRNVVQAIVVCTAVIIAAVRALAHVVRGMWVGDNGF